MNPNISMFLSTRAQARVLGDRSLEAAMDADLARLGYADPQPVPVERVETRSGMETTAVRAPERAVPQAPKRRGGRPSLPRCAHGKTPGNCSRCKS